MYTRRGDKGDFENLFSRYIEITWGVYRRSIIMVKIWRVGGVGGYKSIQEKN